jgi:hypothetical protein
MDWFKDPYELRGKVKWFKEENEAGTYNFRTTLDATEERSKKLRIAACGNKRVHSH